MTEYPTIALTCIIKDDTESAMFRRMLESFMPYMSGLYVAVTGTSGKHQKIHDLVKEFGGKSVSTSPNTHPQIYSKINGKWIFSNFAAARNVSFDIVDEKYDYLAWADVDDVLQNPEEVLKTAQLAKSKDYDVVYFTYWYAVKVNEKGEIEQVVIEHLRERLLKPNMFKWISRLHEVAMPIEPQYNPKNIMYKYSPEENTPPAWIHLTDVERVGATLDRNRVILEIQAEEENYKDPRTLFYLAKCHFDISTPEALEKAEDYLIKYLQMSGWDEERAHALEYLALTYAKRKDYRKTAGVLHEAIKEYPKHHLLYLRLADAYYQIDQNEFADHWLDVALKLPAPTTKTTIGNMYEIKLLTATLCYNKARHEQNIDDMFYWADVRAKLLGKDDGLLDAVTFNKHMGMAVTGIFNFCRFLKDNGAGDKIAKVVESIPEELIDQPLIQALINNVKEPKTWSNKSIVYYASFGGPHFEQWSPKSLEKGIGGSETAVIRLASEWAKLGYDVTVYCDCGADAGMYDGVEYVPYTRFSWKDNYNILILWRSPHLLDKEISAKKLFMDVHDVLSQMQWTDTRMEKVDKIFFKSKMHREYLPKLPDGKAVIISNGI